MKYISQSLTIKLVIITFLMIVFTQAAFGQTSTPGSVSPTISSSEKNETLVNQINELKDKIASRVAQLRLVERHGVVGTVSEASDTRITLRTLTGELKIIDVDEITKFSSPSAKNTFGISDVREGSTLSAIGLYNKQSEHVLARYINSFTLPTFLHGTISSIDEDGFTIIVPNPENTNITVDIERTTRMNTYEDGDIVRSGFTDLTSGDKVNIVGYANADEKNRMSASYLLVINDISAPSISPTPTESE